MQALQAAIPVLLEPLMNTLQRVSSTVIDFLIKGYVPQFLLDTGHSWIKKDPLDLRRNPNAKHLLSSLDSTLRPPANATADDFEKNKYYPADLFRKLEIDNSRYGINRPGWQNAIDRLTEILDSPAALQDVEVFVVDIYNHGYAHFWEYSMYLDSVKMPARLPDLMAKALKSMPNLRRLEWSVKKPYVDDFASAFEDHGIHLDGVRELKVSPFSEFLVRVCPSLEILEPNRGLEPCWRWKFWEDDEDPKHILLKAARGAGKVRKFQVNEGTWKWDKRTVKSTLENLPDLEELSIQSIEDWNWTEPEAGIDETYSHYSEFVNEDSNVDSTHRGEDSDLLVEHDQTDIVTNIAGPCHIQVKTAAEDRETDSPTSLASVSSSDGTPTMESVCSDVERLGYQFDGLPGQAASVLEELLNLLAQFPRLKKVDFPAPLSLESAMRSRHSSGYSHQKPGIRENIRTEGERDALNVEKAGNRVVKGLPKLEMFSIGGYEPLNIGLGLEGTKVTWAWTGRMEEWKMESYPYKGDPQVRRGCCVLRK